MPIKKRYRDFGDGCRAANALDLVGDRWALIIARELILGPKRFAELQASVRGITPAVLTERLRALVDAGIVEPVALSDGAGGYRATAWGRGLEQVLQALGRWYSDGPEARTEGGMTPDAMALAMRTMAPAEALSLPPVVLRLHDSRRPGSRPADFIAEGTADGLAVVTGTGTAPVAIVAADSSSWGRVLFGGLSLAEAERQGDVQVDGEHGPVEELISLYADQVDQ